MTTDDLAPRGFSLRRWSQRKLDATRAAHAPAPSPDTLLPEAAATAPGANVELASATTPSLPQGATPGLPQEALALPPVESLTIDSDFGPFLGPRVDEAVKLQALKKLFRDPRFNVMDGLDTYIDDYSIADPLAPEIARQLAHARYVFDPPRTRVNEHGVVEDVPADELAVDAAAAPAVDATASPAVVVAAAETELLADSAPGLSRSASSTLAPVTEAERARSGETAARPREGSEPAQ